MRVFITDFDMLTPYGFGADTCWNGLSNGVCKLGPVTRFDTTAFQCHTGGSVEGLSYHEGHSLCAQMLEQLSVRKNGSVPKDARLLLATTTGEIDLLEQDILNNQVPGKESMTGALMQKACDLFGVKNEGMVVSSACTSSTAAIALGAQAIREGTHDCVVVVACDGLTEFVYTGFNSLMALSPDKALPFDESRDGLSVGEAAGYIVLMSEERRNRDKRVAHAEVAGWGLSNDANHMTGPSRDGSGLAFSIRTALHSAKTDQEEIGFISAHGTGTQYNDAMEMKAFRQIFAEPRPLFGIKGSIGHSMGAAGLVETVLSALALQNGQIPGTVGLSKPDSLAEGWASGAPVECKTTTALTTNSGFGGVNAALVLKTAEDRI